MRNLKKLFSHALLGASLLLGANVASAAVVNLGFSLDQSGSIGTTGFNTTRDALADALSVIPTGGAVEYRLAITKFSSSVTNVITPTIVTSANIGILQAQLRATLFSGGSTDTAEAIDSLTGLFSSFSSDITIFNITTDGEPNSQTGAENSALNAFNRYVDGISFEAVGSAINNPVTLARMARIAGLGTGGDVNSAVVLAPGDAIPNATQTGFVIGVEDFDDYAAAIRAKLQQVVNDTTPTAVSAPSTLSFIALGMLVLLVRRRTANA